jgi:5-hydroxyisourate hydrolase-like protein (transthyretin family)
MTLTTHVLDTSIGVPAEGIAIMLYAVHGDTRAQIASATTNADGRTDRPLAEELAAGSYALTFAVAPYFVARGVVPLLLAPWGYSTYRGS